MRIPVGVSFDETKIRLLLNLMYKTNMILRDINTSLWETNMILWDINIALRVSSINL